MTRLHLQSILVEPIYREHGGRLWNFLGLFATPNSATDEYVRNIYLNFYNHIHYYC